MAENTVAGDCVPQWDTAIGNPGMNDTVYALAVLPGGDLVAAGNFTMAGGNPANRIARWDGADWHPLGSGLEGGGVLVLRTLPNGDLIAGGNFTSAGGAAANRVARWDGSDWHPMGAGIDDGVVFDLFVLPDGDVIAGGTFTMAGGMQVNHVARWDGSSWHALGDGVPHMIQAIAYFDDGDGPKLYAGGTAPHAEPHALSHWDGDAWSPMPGGLLGNSVIAMTVADDGGGPALFVAADFRVGPTDQRLLSRSAKWIGGGWEPLDMQRVWRGKVIFDDGSGLALYAGSSSPDGIVKWDGNWWLPVADGLNGSVFALTVYDDGTGPVLYAAGSFDSADGEPAHGIVRWQHCAPVPPVTHHVPGDFPTIQAAINAASDGEVILVASGTYNETIDFLGKTIVVESESGPEVTIIDASGLKGPAVTVPSGSDVGTTLRGFTVTGSTARGVHVQHASLTIDGCMIIGNGSGIDLNSVGGGILAVLADSMLVRSTELMNNSALGGGGVAVADTWAARFRDCLFHGNVSAVGGATYSWQAGASFVRCVLENNEAYHPDIGFKPAGGGAAIAIGSGVRAANIFFDCDFIGNSSIYRGGGLYQAGSSLTVHQCRFHDNEAAHTGGAMVLIGNARSTTIVNCAFTANVANSAGAISAVAGSETVTNIKSSFFCENEPDHILGDYEDLGGNVFFDVCDPMPGDLNGDGVVDVSDLLILLAAWGPCADPSNCPADLNGDGEVDATDLMILLGNWG